MPRLPTALILACLASLMASCATRPVNAPISEIQRGVGYRLDVRQAQDQDRETLMVLAFSGGGTRAAAFAYGVLEELRRTEVTLSSGRRLRMLDEIDVITGVSGGSFTALAYGLHGEKLFVDYDQRFLKRDVEGMLLGRLLSPANWSALWSEGWGRSEMAAQLYDEILFEGATFRDLQTRPGPLIVATATDISTGSRLSFTQSDFDLICSSIDSVPLSRAAAASSAVPLVLSPVTLNNYGGTCGFKFPSWAVALQGRDGAARPAGRAVQRSKEMESFQDSTHRPYLHLVDGGLADNLGLRSVLEVMETLENARATGRRTRLDDVRKIAVFVVNSLSIPRTDWDKSARPPNDLMILLKATGVPIDRYSYEALELLKDTTVRWKMLRQIEASTGTARGVLAAPDIEVYAIDVSFASLRDRKEAEYLNDLPTSFALPPEAVDRLRAAGATLVKESSEFERLLKDLGAARVSPP
jgi:NTE family protein